MKICMVTLIAMEINGKMMDSLNCTTLKKSNGWRSKDQKWLFEKYDQDDVNKLKSESKNIDKEEQKGLIENDSKCDTSYSEQDYTTYDKIYSSVTDTINDA